ncbi:MAG: type II toxin-antitoxin system RelE/ParE family toxin [Candidatus Babeliales bacterium]|jgi:phage-related protein
MSKFIAYKGRCFTIEWFFDDRGNSKVFEYFTSLSVEEKNKLLYLFQTMGDFGKIWNQQKFNAEGDQIYAFKPMPHRFLSFFFTGSKIIVTNAFEKKQQKLPSREKDKALNCRQDYETRVKKGIYYEK